MNEKCQVCGREARPHDSLFWGVHADCANDLEVQETMVLAIRDSKQPGKVWYCGNGGLIFVTYDGSEDLC